MRPNTGCHPRRRQPQSKLLSAASGDVAARLAMLIVEIVIRESQDTVVSRVAARLMLLTKGTCTHPQAKLHGRMTWSGNNEGKILISYRYERNCSKLIRPDGIEKCMLMKRIISLYHYSLALCTLLRLEHSPHFYSYAHDVIQVKRCTRYSV